MTDWHIAQMNVGRAVDDVESETLKDFVDNLDRINALAEAHPGFVWRLQSESGNATDIKISDDPRFIVNMSVWTSVEALFDYVYKTNHRDFMVRRREWFEKPTHAFQTLWWIPAGHTPSVEEGLAKLAVLDRLGPTTSAFTFKQRFPAPGSIPSAPVDMKPDPYCVGWS